MMLPPHPELYNFGSTVPLGHHSWWILSESRSTLPTGSGVKCCGRKNSCAFPVPALPAAPPVMLPALGRMKEQGTSNSHSIIAWLKGMHTFG